MLRFTGRNFCVGVEYGSTGIIYRAAPMVRYMIGWTSKRAADYARSRGWTVEVINV